MKKIIAFILCLMVVCVPLTVSAESDETEGAVVGEVIESDITTPGEETPTDGENSGGEDYENGDAFEGETPEETPEEKPPVVETPPVETPPVETPPTFEEEVEMVTEQIVVWLTANMEEIGVVITLIGYGIVLFTRIKTLIKSTGTINNNAITISKASSDAIAQALANIENTSGVVSAYDARITALLEAFKTTAEDKLRLEAELVEIKNYLKTSSQSNLEFADELAELLLLANIPNFKKDELGARHVAAKREIVNAEAKAEAMMVSMMPTTTEEVKENVGEET